MTEYQKSHNQLLSEYWLGLQNRAVTLGADERFRQQNSQNPELIKQAQLARQLLDIIQECPLVIQLLLDHVLPATAVSKAIMQERLRTNKDKEQQEIIEVAEVISGCSLRKNS